MGDSLQPLRDWIEEKSSQAKVARAVRCSEPHLSDILAGRKYASLQLARRIRAECGNSIPLTALVHPDVAEAMREVIAP